MRTERMQRTSGLRFRELEMENSSVGLQRVAH